MAFNELLILFSSVCTGYLDRKKTGRVAGRGGRLGCVCVCVWGGGGVEGPGRGVMASDFLSHLWLC